MRFKTLALAAVMLGATGANAAITIIDGVADVYPGGVFTEVLPEGGTGGQGVYGVENIGGARGNWNIGVGPHTSTTGFFTQKFQSWVSQTAVHTWTLTWDATGITYAVDGAAAVTFAGNADKLKGDTLKVYVKGALSAATVTTIEGLTINKVVAPNTETLFHSSDNWGGDGSLTATGTLSLRPFGGSGVGVLIKHGTFVADVPEPATWAMLISGFGLTGAALRRRRVAAA